VRDYTPFQGVRASDTQLNPNFRGSTGYGKKFLNAGNKQFGLKMQDDLLDSVRSAVKEGIADPAKIGITGHSSGGYCALVALTCTPDLFACAVDSCGPSNLKTIMVKRPASSLELLFRLAPLTRCTTPAGTHHGCRTR
jgi:predicted alpha/beta superfamily hydrolase